MRFVFIARRKKETDMCGGVGFVIGSIVFFGWRKSETRWKRTVAYICAVWMSLSVLLYAAVLGGY